MIQLLILSLMMVAPAIVQAASMTGRASVIDGDTIEIHGQRIRLHGIDAPESGQSCSVMGKSWRCGQQAAAALAGRIGSRPVTCQQRDRDRYNRIVAVCYLGSEDLNAWMVASGWAMAYRRYSAPYIGHEDGAKGARKGIWQGEVIAPWDWRRRKRLQADARPDDLRIKGNINRRGDRIYHMPGRYDYDRTRIEPGRASAGFAARRKPAPPGGGNRDVEADCPARADRGGGASLVRLWPAKPASDKSAAKTEGC